jgi:cytochrome c
MKIKREQRASLKKRLMEKLPALLVLAVVVGGALVMIARFSDQDGSMVDIKLPVFSQQAHAGEKAFENNCLQCHGKNAAGGKGGPPLIHAIYNPGHHGDASFFRAMQQGTRQHHWRFGNMPAQRQVGKADARAIVRYIRELQIANGIVTRPH